MNTFMLSFFLSIDTSAEELHRQKVIETTIGLSGAAVIAIVLIVIYGRYVHYKRKKSFRFKSKFNEYNHVDALVFLSMNVLKSHPEYFREKCVYMKEYVAFLYPNNTSFYESLRFSYTDYYASHTIVKWLNEHLAPSQKEDVVRFLIYMAAQDGVVAQKEILELNTIIEAFDLPINEWKALMDSINQRFYEQQERWRKRNESGSYRSASLKNALEYFGLKEITKDEELLRQLYREKVKLCHPDCFPNATEQERKQYEVEFQQLQMHYEELIKHSIC